MPDQNRAVSNILMEKYIQHACDDLIAGARLTGAGRLSDMVVVIDKFVAIHGLLRTVLHDQWKNYREKTNRYHKPKVRTGAYGGEAGRGLRQVSLGIPSYANIQKEVRQG